MRVGEGPWRSGVVAVLFALWGIGVMGATCGESTPQPQALVYFWNAPQTVRVDNIVHVGVRLFSDDAPLQAYDVGIDFDPAFLEVINVTAEPGGFDDVNLGLAIPPSVDSTEGTIRSIVDFRHGSVSETGEFKVFGIQFRGKSAGDAQISFVPNGISTADGKPFEISSIPISIAVVP